MNIFVGSLPFSIEEADLRGFFEEYGTVDSVNIISDKFPSALYNLEIKRDDTFSRDFEKPN